MAEYNNTGPGFDQTARKASKISKILSDAEYSSYKNPSDVFQFPFIGKQGNIEWIDRSPETDPLSPT